MKRPWLLPSNPSSDVDEFEFFRQPLFSLERFTKIATDLLGSLGTVFVDTNRYSYKLMRYLRDMHKVYIHVFSQMRNQVLR